MWAEWNTWSDCDTVKHLCGDGPTHQRSRSCLESTILCEGGNTQIEFCEYPECSQDGKFILKVLFLS